MIFLTLDHVLAAHARVKGIPFENAIDHVHRRDLLESALARPRNVAGYEGADVATQAASLLWGLVRNHPFMDGNKRTALIATYAFLDLNGHTLDLTEEERFDLVVSVANRQRTVDEVAAVLRERLAPVS